MPTASSTSAAVTVKGGSMRTTRSAVRFTIRPALRTPSTTGAATEADAWLAARAMANSPLVKTAVHGADPNWGRLVAATGRSGAAFVLDQARVRIGSLVLFEQGRPFDERAPLAAQYLQGTNLEIAVDLGTGGPFTATVWTCDLTAEYVKINAEYRT